MRRTLASAAILAVVLTGVAAAQTQRRDVADGTVNAPRLKWEAYAVPQFPNPQGSSLLVDIFNSSGVKQTSYGQHFARGSLGSTGIAASEYRPLSRPTRDAVVAGIVKSRARRVKVFFKDGQTRRTRTVRPPSDWDIGSYRYFAVGVTVARGHADTRQVTARIDAFNADGDRIARTRRVSSF
jgi:hypothetical protein